MQDIEIRVANINDAKDILNIYQYYVKNTAITFEYKVPSLDEFKIRISDTLKKYPYFVAIYNGKISGYAYAGKFVGRAAYNWSASLSIYIDKDMRKQGIGRMLYEALEKSLKEMGIINLYACIGYPEIEDEYLNKNSAQFHKHMGFNKVGEFHKCGYKFDRWYNMIWMEKSIGSHHGKQKPIKSFSEIYI